MFSSKTSRYFGLLILVMLGLRFGYKYYRSQQKPTSQIMMENVTARQQALVEAIRANEDAQRANGATVIVADSAGAAAAAADTVTQAR
ncbi:MAG TPA: hypothetical protein VF629_13365 [Hymenobacter sp.]|jgi:hypothetical protein|uniref:hypothetical protein n=1 Tax=Hymenobacter sp. TaxID=1898978 RepID=UPI002ED80F86